MWHLTDDGADTLLSYQVNAQVGGKLAQLGARLIDASAKQMADQFFDRFSRQVQAMSAGQRRRHRPRRRPTSTAATIGDLGLVADPARAVRPAARCVDRRRGVRRHGAADAGKHALVTALPATVADTAKLLADHGYIADLELATTVHLALAMQRPLFLEGEPGTGKTEIAKVLAAGLNRRLVRLQCYDGMDLSAAAYEWDHARQLMAIRLAEAAGQTDRDELSPRYLHAGVPAGPPAAVGDRSGPAAGGAADRRTRSRG